MSLKRGLGASALLLACCAAGWADAPLPVGPVGPVGPVEGPLEGPACGCASGCCPLTDACGRGCCHCPKTCFTIEKRPCIKWHCVCPKPVCNPCDIEGYGYFPTCWRPWAYPPDYRHCPVPPPGVLAKRGAAADGAPRWAVVPEAAAPNVLPPEEKLPTPKKAANPNPDR